MKTGIKKLFTDARNQQLQVNLVLLCAAAVATTWANTDHRFQTISFCLVALLFFTAKPQSPKDLGPLMNRIIKICTCIVYVSVAIVITYSVVTQFVI